MLAGPLAVFSAPACMPPQVGSPAPELKGARGWLNTAKPLTLKELRGKIVLLDFWTFCCINCMHVLPDLRRLEDKYKNELVVIGIHSAKFENEKQSRTIGDAIQRYGIRHPVANDADFAIWNAYGVNSWPSLVLISPEGKIVEEISGEGHFDKIDAAIAAMIKQCGRNGTLKTDHRQFSVAAPGARTALSFPGKLTVSPDGKTLAISDSGHNRIVLSDLAGHVQAIIGRGTAGFIDGSFDKAQFRHPQGLVYFNDRLYVADTENHAIRAIDLAKKAVATVAGTGVLGEHEDHFVGQPLKTSLNSPWDLCLRSDKLFIAIAGAHQIWWLDLKNNQIGTYAGTGREGIRDGALDEAWFAQPSGITTDGGQVFFIADSEASAVRAINSDQRRVQTAIGHGLFEFGDRDGPANDALLQHPLAVLFEGTHVYIADSYNHKIKKMDVATGNTVTLAGNGHPGAADGPHAQFSEPAGLAWAAGKLFVADTNNNAIRVVDPDTGKVLTLPVQATSASH